MEQIHDDDVQLPWPVARIVETDPRMRNWRVPKETDNKAVAVGDESNCSRRPRGWYVEAVRVVRCGRREHLFMMSRVVRDSNRARGG